ncbi:MAG TPA: peptidoglycan-binding domain-containing protein [Rugosimonospora sp.]
MRRALAGAAVIAVAGSAAAIGYAATARPHADVAVAAGTVPSATAPVTRGTVTETVKIAGTLGFDGDFPVVDQYAPGVLTGVPELGATVGRGGTLYAVANHPVRLLYGAVPAYRGFAAGMPDGPDVAQLEANLVALGFDPGHAMTVDDHFTAATASAIRRWQASWGVPAGHRTGALEPGEVVFLPGALRVGQVQATLGTTVAPGAPVLHGTSTNRVVTVELTTDRQSLVHRGDGVRVGIGDATPVVGTVSRIGRVATAPTSDNGPASTGGGSASAPATVPVTITLTPPPGAADLDQAPAQVSIVVAEHPNVLLVPVAALLARPGGGYQVRLASGGYLAVQPGLFDDDAGTVEVAGAGLNAGDRVEVPAS